MILTDIKELDPRSCVLFLGSGFSADATNARGESPPNGKDLRLGVLRRLNLSTDPGYDLRVLADELIEQNATSFANWLNDIFRISSMPDSHRSILKRPWQRIYTTNYDDLVELERIERGQKPSSYDVDDSFPTKIGKGSVIHLHGSIRNATADQLKTSLVLGEHSYIWQHLKGSLWYAQFQRDIAFAEHVFFIGYSLSDYLISALLTQNPRVAERTTFIRRNAPDSIEANRLKPYGSIEAMSINAFATWLDECPKPAEQIDLSRLKAFRTLDPDKDGKSAKVATAPEIHDLLIYGTVNTNRIFSTLPSQNYVANRQTYIDEAISLLNDSRFLLVDSRIGNGKSVFLSILATSLRAAGKRCFLYKSGHPEVQREIDLLLSVDNVVIFFDNYNESIEIIKKLSQDLPSASFVIEIRSSIYQLRFHELQAKISHSPRRLSINELVDGERDTILSLASRAGLPSQFDRRHQRVELRDILLNLFENKAVQDSIKAELAPFFQSKTLRRLIIAACLIGTNRLAIGPEIMHAISIVDPYPELIAAGEISSEILAFDIDGVELRSSLFGEFLLTRFAEIDEICELAEKLISFCADKKDNVHYRGLMGELMTYGNLFDKLGQTPRATRKIIGIYESLRKVDPINDDPLFWLQYAIASVDDNRLDLAETYIDRSYERALLKHSFETYQIDTQAFRIACLAATANASGRPVHNFDEILRLSSIIEGMLREESHRPFAVKVLENIRPFVAARKVDLLPDQKKDFAGKLGGLASAVRSLPQHFVDPATAESIASGLELEVQRLFSN